jgi:hypothetical protein
MGKQTAQGTKWETRIVKTAARHGRTAERLAKRGIKGEPDVRIDGRRKLPVVFWENWVKRQGRRRGVRMVTLLEEDFWKLVDKDDENVYGFYVQAKSTQTLGVRAVLERLIEAIGEGDYR